MRFEEGDIVTVDCRDAEEKDPDFKRIEEDYAEFLIEQIWRGSVEYEVSPISEISTTMSVFYVKERSIMNECGTHGVEKLYSKSADDYICPFCNNE